MRLLIVSEKRRIAGYSKFAEALDQFGVEAICVHDLQHCYLSESKPLHVIPVPKLLRLVKRFNPDAIMTDSSRYVPYMAKLVSRSVFLHVRGDPWSESYVDRVMYPSISARAYTTYLVAAKTLGIRCVDLILPNCEWLQRKIAQNLPNHPNQVLYVGISPEEWVPNRNRTFDVRHPAVAGVLSFGIYAKVSGLLRFARVVKKMPDVSFFFAGSGPYLDLIKQNCPRNMFLIGRISKPEVKKLLERCDVFVHPSGLDALPRSVKEASLMEKPIVASNVGGIPEIVIDNQTGYLCNNKDVDQWTGKIRFLLDNPDIAKKFGKKARQFVARTFDWREIARAFVKDVGAFR